MPTGDPKHFYCPGCGHRVVHTVGKLGRNCIKCGVLLREGEPPKPGKRSLILLLIGLGGILGFVIYLALK